MLFWPIQMMHLFMRGISFCRNSTKGPVSDTFTMNNKRIDSLMTGP